MNSDEWAVNAQKQDELRAEIDRLEDRIQGAEVICNEAAEMLQQGRTDEALTLLTNAYF